MPSTQIARAPLISRYDLLIRPFFLLEALLTRCIQEFMLAMTLCSSENPEDKLRFCFKSLDLDNNGWLDREEVLYAVELIFKHNPGLENKVAADVNTPQKARPLAHSSL